MMTVQLHGSWAEITITGELNSNTAPEADLKVAEALRSAQSLVLDMAGLDYLSSAGLRTILLASKTVRDKNGKLAISGASDKIKRVFQLSGLLRHFHCFDQMSEAQSFILG